MWGVSHYCINSYGSLAAMIGFGLAIYAVLLWYIDRPLVVALKKMLVRNTE